MKKLFASLFALFLIIAFIKCKPAAEDRVKMHQNAKRISDSIGRVIDSSMVNL